MPVKALGDARLSMGARLLLMILWGRCPTKREHKVTVSKAALQVTMNKGRNTVNRYSRELMAVGWVRYDNGTWWLQDECDSEAA